MSVIYLADSEPYARVRDNNIVKLARESNINVIVHTTHTIHNLGKYLKANNNELPKSYGSFIKLFYSLGEPDRPIEFPNIKINSSLKDLVDKQYDVPTLLEMGYLKTDNVHFLYKGGENEALERLNKTCIQRSNWVTKFEKPKTEPNSLQPSTTVLSPYLKFGCLSSRKFYYEIDDILKQNKLNGDGKNSIPPESLHGQLLFREFFYLNSFATPNFDKMIGNPSCKQIPWKRDVEMINAWKFSRTGYPYIDAIMNQLKQEGWIHHLARHSVACFLTRGDLYQHWEEGVKVFDELLLDSDWALNNANWQWLSCSNFFYQYFRCYSPVVFGKKTDKNGDYIRKYLPILNKYPAKYIYEPWLASKKEQESFGCIVGIDYPNRIVIHEEVSKENMNAMKIAYENNSKDKNILVDYDKDVEHKDKKTKL